MSSSQDYINKGDSRVQTVHKRIKLMENFLKCSISPDTLQWSLGGLQLATKTKKHITAVGPTLQMGLMD